MARHTVTVYTPGQDDKVVTRTRFDAFLYQGHKAVYEVASRYALRDTKAAWRALDAVYHMGRHGLSHIHLGDSIITLNSDV